MSLRYRAYPTDGQLYGLRTHCAHARFVWNLACEQQSCYRVAGRSSPPPNSTVRFRQLAEARADNDWLASGSSSVQQQALRDFDQAMAVFFAGTHRKPSWREAGRNEGFCVRDVTVRRLNRRWSAVQVPKVGELRFRLSRPLPAKTGMARVSLDRAGRWHVAFTAAQPPVDREPTGSAIGIDRGVATTVALSDGQHRRAPHSGKAERKTCTLNARMSRQHRGSRRRQRTKQSLRG
jgi:putative transposase